MNVLARRLLGERFGALALPVLEREGREEPTRPGTGGPDDTAAQSRRRYVLARALGQPGAAL